MGAGNQACPLQEQSELSTSKHRSIPNVIVLLLLEMGSHWPGSRCADHVGLKLTQRPSCLCLTGAGIKGILRHTRSFNYLVFLFYLLRQGFSV